MSTTLWRMLHRTALSQLCNARAHNALRLCYVAPSKGCYIAWDRNVVQSGAARTGHKYDDF